MFTWLVEENATGDRYLVTTAHDRHEEVYQVFGSAILHLPPPIDTGNVDINLLRPEAPSGKPGDVVRI